MTTQLTGKGLTIHDIERVARQGEQVELHPEAVQRIKACRAFIQERIAAREIMYGVNTGIGEFSEVLLDDEQVEQFQRYLIYNHAAGIGEPCPVEHVRAAMLLRINVHCNGHSAPRMEITQTLVDMLNKGVTPVVCEKGSVGACGDLAPMSQIALLMMGEGEAFYQGERLPGRTALLRAGIPVPGLQARDGLAVINGSNLINGISALIAVDTLRFFKQAEVATAMTLEALNANLKPYDERLHLLRGFPGAVITARNLQKVLQGSSLYEPHQQKVQDAYSMRSTPQVLGAARDQLQWTIRQIEIEANGVGDNPVFLPEDQVVLTGANFQGTPVSMPVDTLGGAITMVCVISERRMNRLTNPALSVGLPPFLTQNPGLMSGLMLSQYTADTQIVEQKTLSTPAFYQSIPAAADQEDFVSMGMNSALKTRQILDISHGVIGIELMAAAQAIDLREGLRPGRGTAAAHAEVRRHVEFLDVDRPLYNDHNAMLEAAARWDVLEAVEAEIGPLLDA